VERRADLGSWIVEKETGMVTYIVVSRNPNSKRLVIISDDDDTILEFNSEDEAYAAAKKVACCRAWGAECVPIDRD